MKLTDYLKKNPKKYLIFDLDRTLVWIDVDWSHYHQELYKVLKNIDEVLANDFLLIKFGSLEWRVAVNNFIKRYGEKGDSAVKEFNEQYEEKYYLGKDKLNVELIDFIKSNYKKFNIYLLTGNATSTVSNLLKRYKINEVFFKKIVTNDDFVFIKPNISGFNKIFVQGQKKEDYLMIGDSKVADEELAKNAGIDYFSVKMNI